MEEFEESQDFHNEDGNDHNRGERRNFNRGGPRRNFNRGGPRRNFGPREMHKATCAECGKECEVPFKPAEDRPVYCQDCYKKKKGF